MRRHVFPIISGTPGPALTALDYDQADSAGGDEITITGTDLDSATGVTVGGTSATILANTSTSLTFAMPAKAAGSHNVQVTTAGGSSNTLSIETWAPTDEASCTLLFDSKHTAYSAGTWAPRYSVVGSANMTTQPGGASDPLVTASGAPVWDGDASTEGGLKSGKLWSDYLSGATGHLSSRKGSVAAIFASSNTTAISTGAPYNNPTAVGNSAVGTIGVGFGNDGITPSAVAHIYDGGGTYHTIKVAATAKMLHSVVARWESTSSATFGLSVDGDTSGAGYVTDTTTGGASNTYAGYSLYTAMFYDGATVGRQTFAGPLPAWAIFNDTISDAVVTKISKWARCRWDIDRPVTARWDAAFAGSPWIGDGNANGHIMRWVEATNPPSVGGAIGGRAINGYSTADFDGSNDILSLELDKAVVGGSVLLRDLFKTAAYGGWILVNIDAIATNDASSVYENDCIITTLPSAYWILYLRSGGGSPKVGIRHVHSGGEVVIEESIATGAWKLIQWKYDGTNLKLRVNSGAWQSTAAANLDASGLAGSSVTLGKNYGAAHFFDGRIAPAMGFTNVCPSDAYFDDIIKARVNTKFALSL